MNMILSPELSLTLNTPEKVKNINVSAITSSQATISWEGSLFAERYLVFIKDASGVLRILTSVSTTLTVTSLLSLQDYVLWIKAVNSGSESENSELISFSTI